MKKLDHHPESDENQTGTSLVPISKRLVFINAASSVATRLLNVFVLLWIYNYLLARISPEEFAVYPVVAAVIVFAPLFFSTLTGGISRYIIEAYARGDLRRGQQILSSITLPLFAVSLVFLLVGLVFSRYIDAVLTIPPDRVWDAQLMMALLVLAFSFKMLLLPFSVGFDVKQRFVQLNLIHICRDLVRIALLLTLLLTVSPRVIWVVVATVSVNIVAALVVAWFSRRMLPHLRFDRSLFDWKTTRELLDFGIWSTLGQVSFMIYTSAGPVVLNKLATAVDVTAFHVGAMMDRQIRLTTSMAAKPGSTSAYGDACNRRQTSPWQRFPAWRALQSVGDLYRCHAVNGLQCGVHSTLSGQHVCPDRDRDRTADGHLPIHVLKHSAAENCNGDSTPASSASGQHHHEHHPPASHHLHGRVARTRRRRCGLGLIFRGHGIATGLLLAACPAHDRGTLSKIRDRSSSSRSIARSRRGRHLADPQILRVA